MAEGAYPYVQADFDPPQTLEELQEAARANSPDNQELSPTLKHWQLNAWCGTKDAWFGGKSPRAYVRGKSWQERQRVGLIGLRHIRVLK